MRKIAFRDSQIITTYHIYIGDMTGHGVIEFKLCAAELAWKSFYIVMSDQNLIIIGETLSDICNTHSLRKKGSYTYMLLQVTPLRVVFFADRALVIPSLRNIWSDWKCPSRRNWVVVQNVLEIHFLLRRGQIHGNELQSMLRGGQDEIGVQSLC